MPRLEPKLRHEKQSRSNRFTEVDIEERDVPMHRAYGKTRKVNPRLEKLKENGFLEDLSREILVTAELRLEYPEATLSELAELHNPPISKSGLSHRLSKIAEEAKKRKLI